MNIPAVATDCSFRKVGDYLRAEVGARLGAHEVEDCYRVLATVVIEHRQSRVLVVGVGAEHPHSHLSARDALIAIHEIGMPAGFRIAFVALSASPGTEVKIFATALAAGILTALAVVILYPGDSDYDSGEPRPLAAATWRRSTSLPAIPR